MGTRIRPELGARSSGGSPQEGVFEWPVKPLPVGWEERALRVMGEVARRCGASLEESEEVAAMLSWWPDRGAV